MRTEFLRVLAATSLLAASVGCGGDASSGTAGAGSAGLSSATGAGPGSGTAGASSMSGPGAGSGGDAAGAGGDTASTGGGATGGTGGASSGAGGGEVAGCRPISDEPPGCAFEAPLVIDDSTPDEGGVVTIRDRCFLQPDTVALNEGGTQTEPAIRIRTERPVVLENVVTVSAGAHVVAEGFADVTIRGASGYGLEPTVDDVPRGTYLTMYGFARATVERSYLSHTRGLQLWEFEGDDAGERSIRIVNNVVRNVDGRCRNTGGGCGNTGNYQFSNFVSFNGVRGKGIEIAWNDVHNEPHVSSVEDNLGLYRAAGTADAPMIIHHNAIRGGYEFPVSDNYTGSCMTTDGDPESVDEVGFIEAHDNLCISVPMNIAGGHDIHYRDNIYASAGLLPDGSPSGHCFWCIGGIYDFYDGGNLVNDSIENLRFGLPEGFDGFWVAEGEGNTMTVERMPEPATLEMEAELYAAWCESAAAAGVVLGP